MASSVMHNDIRKIVNLLVNSVHMVKSPANRKKFFIVKGEKMTDEELVKKLKEQNLDEEEIKYMLGNEQIKQVLINDENEKKALDVTKDGIRNILIDVENALESDKISDIMGKLVNPLEQFANFIAVDDKNDDDKNDDKDDSSNDDTKDTKEGDKSEEIDSETMNELTEELSGLADDLSELVDEIV